MAVWTWHRAGGLTPFRASDAVHLASAARFAEAAGEVRFACWDRRLWEAAGVLCFIRVPEALA